MGFHENRFGVPMYVDLIKLVFLLLGLSRFGSPDLVDHAFSLKLAVSYDGISLQAVYDPVLVYYTNDIARGYCGIFLGSYTLINPQYKEMGCDNTLKHELAHAWQYRNYGLLQPISYMIDKSFWEGKNPSTEVPYHKKVLNFGLVTFSLPVLEFKH